MRMPTHDPRCLCWYWNWFNESAVDYYLNELVLPQVSKEGFDGIFFDGSDGFLRGTWRQAVNVPHNASDQDALEATVGVHKRGAELLLAHGKYPIYSELRTLITRGDLLKPRRESVITSLPPRTVTTLVGRATFL
jgi:hypothetical protein